MNLFLGGFHLIDLWKLVLFFIYLLACASAIANANFYSLFYIYHVFDFKYLMLYFQFVCSLSSPQYLFSRQLVLLYEIYFRFYSYKIQWIQFSSECPLSWQQDLHHGSSVGKHIALLPWKEVFTRLPFNIMLCKIAIFIVHLCSILENTYYNNFY